MTNNLLKFPCEFPIKIFVINQENVLNIIQEHCKNVCDDFIESNLQIKQSKKANYLSLTWNVKVESQQILDQIYQSLNKIPQVKLLL